MAWLGKAKKADLVNLASELSDEEVGNLKVSDLKDIILKSESFQADPDFYKEFLSTIIEERVSGESLARAEAEKTRNHELEVLRLQKEISQLPNPVPVINHSPNESSRIDLKSLLPPFNADKDNMNLYLVLFERQMTVLKIPEERWVSHLITVLPCSITKLIAREPEERFSDYNYIKIILLERFKLTAEKFRELFFRHPKSAETTWKDFYFEIRNFFESWISELEITEFEQLKDLIIADQMKKKCSAECRNHFLDSWEKLTDPVALATKFDCYDNLRSGHPSTQKKPVKQFPSHQGSYHFKKRYPPAVKTESSGEATSAKNLPVEKTKPFRDETSLRCFGCGTPGFIKAKCPNCNPMARKDHNAEVGNLHLQLLGCSTATPEQKTLMEVIVNDIPVIALYDTGATRSIAGEKLYTLLNEKGIPFARESLQLTLADGQKSAVEAQIATVDVKVKDRTFPVELVALPHAKGNRTILGLDFIMESGVVTDPKNNMWFFTDEYEKKYPLHCKPAELTGVIPKIMEVNSISLRDDEGQTLTYDQRNNLNLLLEQNQMTFAPGGEATPFIQHHIDTGDHPPVAVPPYRVSPARREMMKAEIDELLKNGVIEECDSAYASPVVLVPKPDGRIRLCVDYRKLNSITKTSCYPLPRIDDLLHDAKVSTFMSTIDLRSGYHQVSVYPPDRDKTAFICSYGTYRFTRMPFGLKNAPSTFQKLMDNFKSGLPEVHLMAYLDDIIILSESFEKHLDDLKAVFQRLDKYHLRANREKCRFACDKVKYLGHWITPRGIEMDSEKVSAILKIPAPTSVKQVLSFIQTCSWYRRFIPKFAEVARPLTDLTKKKVSWTWGERENCAFETLKQCLTSSPVLKQADDTRAFVIRTDASGYAIGAVLLQGSGEDEHPIEYASRLLTNAERNYSTTEREALAVLWALNKYRGYIDGAEIVVASDHQPLKWLLSLKSPSGRLARWALQLQSFNVKMEYIPGKANVIADLLSRPPCDHESTNNCETCSIKCDAFSTLIDMPTRSPKDIREEQLKDDDLKKIIECFEKEPKDENFSNWTSRGYLMNQGILFRYAPDAETEEAQLVIPVQEREKVLKEHHDAPTAGHYGADGTYHRISQRYYWTGMRRYITDYVRNCIDCNRYKPSNQKPTGLLRTPVYAQRMETISIDLFGPLPESSTGKRWIFIVEDCCTKWVEIFALTQATAKECAMTLLDEVILRFGLPRRIISDNGTQFISAVMQQICYLLKIDQVFTPLYHPQANLVERKNRDLKPRIAILVGDKHDEWEDKLPAIRFSLNSAKCDTTGVTPAYLQFGREMRTIDDVTNDFKAIVDNDNFVPEITPYLQKLAKISTEIRDRTEMKQDRAKKYADKRRGNAPMFMPDDLVFVEKHTQSSRTKGRASKFAPRRDGPYKILTIKSPTTYDVGNVWDSEKVGTYHVSALKPFKGDRNNPFAPLRKRGRPPKRSAGSS